MKHKSTKLSRAHYPTLLKKIGQTFERAKENAIVRVNNELVKANWEIGRHIIEFEQKGKQKADYGSQLLDKLSKDLKKKYGKGFSRRNILDMRRFYLAFPIRQTLSAKLSWSHYSLLLSISNLYSRKFYFEQSQNENWSVRELSRQISASLYERMILSRNKKSLAKKVRSKKILMTARDIVKDPYVLDFLNIPEKAHVSERYLEQRIIDNLQMFILELGKGFAFVARQFKIPIGSKPHSVDLVFYHRILKCFVLFDVKSRPFRHSDTGQMNSYLNYIRKEENEPGDNEPIGVILSAEKDEVLVEYALGGLSNKIFVSKYQLHLPDKKELRKQVTNFILPAAGTLPELKMPDKMKKLKPGRF